MNHITENQETTSLYNELINRPSEEKIDNEIINSNRLLADLIKDPDDQDLPEQ